jgi:hypothetical protein
MEYRSNRYETLAEQGDPLAEVGTAVPRRRERDTTDYDQRHFANLCAIAFLLSLALCSIAVIKLFEHQLKLEKCIMSGRKDCVEIAQGAPRGMVILPRHARQH